MNSNWDLNIWRVDMTKSDLIAVLAQRKDLSIKVSEEIVDIIFDNMTDAMLSGERIEIRGFASFAIKEYKAYSGRNPKTGEPFDVKPKKSPFFKVGKELKERIAKS
jgi:integration host factor subunit beta